MKAHSRTVLLAAVLCTAIPDIGASTATAAVAPIAAAMPEVPVSLVQMIVSIPSICLIFFPPIYSWLVTVVRKRVLLVCSFVLMMTGAVWPMFTRGIYELLASRVVLGLGNSIIMPITIDYIMDMYSGRERQSVLGCAAAVTSIGGIVFQLLGGILGMISYRCCFLGTCFCRVPIRQ